MLGNQTRAASALAAVEEVRLRSRGQGAFPAAAKTGSLRYVDCLPGSPLQLRRFNYRLHGGGDEARSDTSMSTSLVSSQPVAIPSGEVPEGFRLLEGSDRRVIKAGEAPVPCSLCLSSLSFCVRKCGGEDAVSIEAWFPSAGTQPEGCRCFLTREAVEALCEPK